MKALVIIVLTFIGQLHSTLSIGQGKPAANNTKPYKAVPLPAKLKEYVAIIEQGNYFTFIGSDDDRVKYPVFSSFLALDSLAKDKELLFLTQHAHPIVRCYAFWALLSRNHPDWLSILIHHLADPETLNVDTGDTPGPDELVGDVLLSIVERERGSYTKRAIISPAQQQVMDSVLIFSAPKLAHRNDLFVQLKTNERNYARIQQLVVSEQDYFALIALARFRKPADRVHLEQTLKRHLAKILDPTDDEQGSCAFQAVCEYPDAAFLDELVSIHQSSLINWKRGWYTKLLYKALVRYETPQMHALLLQAIQDTTNTRKGATYNRQTSFIYVALERYPSPYWNELRAKIPMSEEEKQMYLSMIDLN